MKVDFERNKLLDKMQKIATEIYEVPKDFREYMNSPARFYMSEPLFQNLEDGAIRQTLNITRLPRIVKYSIALPDCHWGGMGSPLAV